MLYGAPEPVSEREIIDNCFSERCPTKQGVTRAVDLHRRCTTTMRLGHSILARTTRSVFRGSDSHLDCHSVPLPLKIKKTILTRDPLHTAYADIASFGVFDRRIAN